MQQQEMSTFGYRLSAQQSEQAQLRNICIPDSYRISQYTWNQYILLDTDDCDPVFSEPMIFLTRYGFTHPEIMSRFYEINRYFKCHCRSHPAASRVCEIVFINQSLLGHMSWVWVLQSGISTTEIQLSYFFWRLPFPLLHLLLIGIAYWLMCFASMLQNGEFKTVLFNFSTNSRFRSLIRTISSRTNNSISNRSSILLNDRASKPFLLYV